MSKQRQAYLYALISVLLWSTVASAFKISLRYLDVLQLLFYASLTSVVIFFVILVIQNKLKLLRAYSKKDYLHSALLGFLNPFLYYIVLFKAYTLLPAQEAQPLNYTWPLVLALLSIPLLKQKIGFKNIFAIVVSFIGVYIISTRGNILGFCFTNIKGVLLALSSTVIWSLFWIFNIKDTRDAVAKLFLSFAFGFVYILISLLLFSRAMIPDIFGITGAVYVGFFEMGVTFVIWLKALKLSKTTAQVGNLIYLSPFLSLILINRVVGEKILISTLIGLVLIVTGIVIQNYKAQSQSKEEY